MHARGMWLFTVPVGLTLVACASITVAAGWQIAIGSEEAAVRAARALSNAAIAAHDIAGIARHWMPDVHIVTSTSAQGTGREVNGERMAQQFSRRRDTIYVRTPSAVDVFGSWSVASERGEWTGRWTEPDGVVNISGTYLAQWRNVDGTWLIQAELFVPTACRGSSYCTRRP
jgi:ketosteroid isomerase-like protein